MRNHRCRINFTQICLPARGLASFFSARCEILEPPFSGKNLEKQQKIKQKKLYKKTSRGRKTGKLPEHCLRGRIKKSDDWWNGVVAQYVTKKLLIQIKNK